VPMPDGAMLDRKRGEEEKGGGVRQLACLRGVRGRIDAAEKGGDVTPCTTSY
jgi:hypothetical protein